MEKTKLDYTSGATIIPEDAFGISPSNVGKFFDSPHDWYQSQVLGNELFTGSTATFLGTVVHFCGEQYAETKKVDKMEIYQYLYNHLCLSCPPLPSTPEEAETFLYEHANHPEIDCRYVLDQYRLMGMALIDTIKHMPITSTEELISREVMPGYYAAGSADMVSANSPGGPGKHLFDYKTTSALTAPKKITHAYKLQLLTYAWIYAKRGIRIETINIMWITNSQTGRVGKTGNALADKPAVTSIVTLAIGQEDLELIENYLKLMCETVEFTKTHPEYTHIAFRDARLRPQVELKEFKF